MAERELLVRIVGDDRDLQRALKSTDARLQSIDNRTAAFGKNIKTAFATAGIAVGTSVVIAEVQKSVAAASDLNEQLSRINVILGESAQETIDWSKTTASAFGISQRAALAASATFAGLFQTVGVAQQEAGELSRTIVELAADLASLQNTSTAEAIQALRSGLAGEAEPLRRFNIFLTEVRVQEEALAETGKKTAASLTAQEKALARYNLILRDAAPAVGNFELTSEELANQQRILTAQIDDLEAALGQVLIPTLTDVVSSLNDAVEVAIELQGALQALKDIGGIDIPINLPISIIFNQGRGKDLGGGLKDLGDNIRETVESAFSAGIDPFKQLADRAQGGPGRGFTFFPSTPDRDDPAEQAKNEAKKQEDRADTAEEAAKKVRRAKTRQQKAFAEFSKGLGLKLDKARLTEGLDDDLAALRELERAILRQIEREGKTFKLVDKLTQTRLQIAGLVQQQARDAADAARDAFDATLDALDLDFEAASSTKSLKDDQAALRAIEQAILDRIASEGRTTELLRQLLQVRQQQADVARQLVEQRRTRRQERQFEALGLTEEGDKPTPGPGALRRRANSLEEQIKGTVLDTEKTRQQLDHIRQVLAGKFGQVGKDVRAAILQMLNDISDALTGGGKQVERAGGEITRGGIRSTQRLLRNVTGLTEEQRRQIQANNLGVSGRRGLSVFGVGLVPSTATAGSIDRRLQRTETFVIQNLTVVTNDPNDLMKKLQKKARRSSGGRRGRHGGANLGMQ